MVHVALQKITKRFGGVTALEDISFEVAPGSFLTLVGPSGCGKTTTLRLIAGFEAPDSGDIFFDGQSILTLPPEERGVGIVFQNYALFPHMNVWQNIAYGLKFSKQNMNKKERVDELLSLMDLVGLEGRDPAELSAGQRQRVALARALAPKPKVLLLDEPLSALDAKLRERLRLEIKRIQRELKITTIYVTHDQEEALAISDKVVVMSQGCIEQIGTPWQVYNEPRTEFVAGFIGRGNLLTAKVVSVTNNALKVSLGREQPEILLTKDKTALIGDEIKFLIRPEKIALNGSKENVLSGKVSGIEFLGDAVWVHVDCGLQELIVKAPASEAARCISMDLEGEACRISISFDPKDCRII